jgi:hypothetical protein
MAASTPARRALASQIAAIQRHSGSDDPRLDGLRHQLGETRSVDELRAWAERARSDLPPMAADDIEAVAAIAARLDARLQNGAKT